MSTALSVIRRYADQIVRDRRSELVPEVVADDVIAHEPTGDFRGIDVFLDRMDDWARAFPEGEITTEDLFGHGDRVAWRWRLVGLHTSGALADVRGTIVFRLQDGKIAEYWGVYDRLSLQEQVSAAGEPPQAGGPAHAS